ncbi:hypothetical protein ABZ461_31770 [Actinacidiphila glaucinigra]|uniref:hypothetical protein n=1 Tax=Actinacidiphila glaucinigra TaxID=235986 RepID=UPI003409C568
MRSLLLLRPPGTEPCRITVDPSSPSQLIVTSDVFLKATSDGATLTVKFGKTGPITFESPGAVRFSYAWGGLGAVPVNADADGVATVPNLQPLNAGPNTLQVYAYDSLGNASARTDYTTYVPPKDNADAPGDTTHTAPRDNVGPHGPTPGLTAGNTRGSPRAGTTRGLRRTRARDPLVRRHGCPARTDRAKHPWGCPGPIRR